MKEKHSKATKGQDTRTPEERAADHARRNILAAWDATTIIIRQRYGHDHEIGRAVDRLDGERQRTDQPPKREIVAALDLLAETIEDETGEEGELLRGWRSHEAIASAERAFIRELQPEATTDERLCVIVRGLAHAVVTNDEAMLAGMAELTAEVTG